MEQQPPGPPPGGMQPPPPPPGQPPQAPMGPPKMKLDTSQLPVPEIIVVIGSLIGWIVCLLSWYKAKYVGDFFGVSFTYRGNWQWLAWVIYFLLMLFAIFVLANKYGNFVDLNLPFGVIYLAAGIAGTVVIFLGILIRPGGWDVSTMNWAVWIIALILSAIPIVGGVLEVRSR